uniref:carnitine O-acetyltransferase-like isoform X1 n=1 Tax=Scatophagus argus TaxID=75038 RepID=UPI001ED7E073|nr:carnitine O-acetyltransferase-like isoform X1 [Scatophagus argus]XP_046235389.1 carnitine O-acetyltransferase-like isoform X1 [Scatophagus argus]
MKTPAGLLSVCVRRQTVVSVTGCRAVLTSFTWVHSVRPDSIMFRLCSRALVKMGKMKHLVKPGSVTMVSGRHLSQYIELPRLPVPPLQQTCELYLSILEPFVEEDELRKTKELVEEFLKAGGIGERLQRALERKACTTENWLTDNYVKFEYLNARKPVVIFSNPALLLNPEDYGDRKQIRCAAIAIAGFLDVITMYYKGTLYDHMGGRPLCMKQFEQMISSCRIPGLKTDTLVFHSKSSSPTKHITVVHNCQFFKLDVYHSDGTMLTVDQLCVQLEKIRNSSLQTNTEPVGILTTQQRDVWGKIYNNLIKDNANKESLLAIESSLFTICLDGVMSPAEESHSAPVLQMLHGGGSQWSSGNRWFDKGLQIIVAQDGTCGVNCSHAAADGMIQMSITDYTVEQMRKHLQMQAPPGPLPLPLPAPQKIHFNLTPDIKKDIEEAKQHMDTLAQNLDLTVTVFHQFGKSVLKALRMSPDAFVQMALQLAYYRMQLRCCPVLEPTTLRLFNMGRLAGMNTTTGASVAFVKAFDDPTKQSSEKVELLEEAIKAHRRYSMMGISGQSVETHLFGLELQAVEENIPMPDIFTDTSYIKAFDYKIWTSQVTSQTGCLPFLGPEEPGIFNVCYGIKNNHIDFIVSHFEASETSRENKAAPLVRAVEEALLDMKTLLEQTLRTKLEMNAHLKQ